MAIHKDFAFLGRLCLDFAQTGDMGWGTRFERLKGPSELRRWLSLSSLRLPGMRVSKEDLNTAKMLRGAIWRVVGASLRRAIPAAGDIRLINRIAREAGLARELDLTAKSMRWRRPAPAAALATIAQDAIMLLGEPAQRKRIRRCENAGCRVVFFDDSRPGLRRWCASNRCGDRVRAQRYRDRRKAAAL
jgi:predicted RNA-binding Zn ribbon-like protein